MIVDAHVKIGPSFNQTGKTVQSYMQQMEANQIDKAVLCPNRPASYSFAEGNDYVATCIADFPDLFFGAYRGDPWNWSVQNADLYFIEKNFKILYLNPWEDNYRCNDQIVLPLYEYAREKGLPVLIETGYPFVSHVSQVGNVAEQFPDVKFIITNAGQIDLSGFSLADVSYILALCPNIYVGTAAAVGAEWLANHVQNTSKGRVVFETGYPFFDPYLEKYRITKAYINEEEKEDVFSNNLLTILK